MDHRVNLLGSGRTDPSQVTASSPGLIAPTQAPLRVPRGGNSSSQLWIAVVAVGFFLLLPSLADLGCGFSPPGTIAVMQQAGSHCLWQIGAKGYRFPVGREGRIARPAKGFCVPDSETAERIADALNRRLPLEYAECLDRREGGVLQFWTRALGFY